MKKKKNPYKKINEAVSYLTECVNDHCIGEDGKLRNNINPKWYGKCIESIKVLELLSKNKIREALKILKEKNDNF